MVDTNSREACRGYWRPARKAPPLANDQNRNRENSSAWMSETTPCMTDHRAGPLLSQPAACPQFQRGTSPQALEFLGLQTRLGASNLQAGGQPQPATCFCRARQVRTVNTFLAGCRGGKIKQPHDITPVYNSNTSDNKIVLEPGHVCLQMV